MEAELILSRLKGVYPNMPPQRDSPWSHIVDTLNCLNVGYMFFSRNGLIQSEVNNKF